MKKILLAAFALSAFFTAHSATFTSNVVSGDWSVMGSWTVVGFDANGIPDLDDDVTIVAGHTIRLMGLSDCRDLTVSAGGTLNYNNKTLYIRSNYVRAGSTTASGVLYFFGSLKTITITGTYSNGGNWNFMNGSNYTIAAGATIVKTNYFYVNSGAVLTNLAVVNLTGGSVSTSGTGTFINGVNATLAVARPFLGPVANFNFSAAGNMIRYSSTLTPNILFTTYHHLDLINTAGTKTWSGGTLTVNGNLRIFAGCTLNCASQDINLGGNWVNFSTITATNQATINFNGSGTQTISRTTGSMETFNNMALNGTGTVTLVDSITLTGGLSINSGTLDVSASNFNIHCRGDFNDNATFIGNSGTVFMDGSIPQNIDGIGVTSFYNLTISNAAGITVKFPKDIRNILYVQTGMLSPSVLGSIRLVATSSTVCAKIAPLGAGGSLGGTNWVIQTWIHGPATAYWQYLASPVAGNNVGDWDTDTRFYMSGVGGNEGNACCPIFRSVRTYNEPTNTYTNITSTGTALTAGRGFMIWMSDNMAGLASPLVYDSRGLPNSGTVNRAVTAGGTGAGYNLVGNPFACPVDYSDVVAASTATLNASFVILTESGSYVTDPNGGVIAGGQGFMCIATGGGNLTFTESCKNTTANPNVIREGNPANTVRIRAGNEVNGLGEETTVRLSPDGDRSYDGAIDLPYLASPYENATHIWTGNEFGNQFLLNDLGASDDHLLIPLSVVTSSPGVQTLTFKGLNTVSEYNCAWIEDLNTGARINLNEVDTYSFEENELGVTRNFILHFERTNDCTFDLQATQASLDAQTNVYVNAGQVYAQFDFGDEEIVQVSMFDLSGRMVMGETTMNVTKQTVALENPGSHGIYLVRIVKGNEVTTKKFYY